MVDCGLPKTFRVMTATERLIIYHLKTVLDGRLASIYCKMLMAVMVNVLAEVPF